MSTTTNNALKVKMGLTCIAFLCTLFDKHHTNYFSSHTGYQNQFLFHLDQNHLFFLEH
jgi:hypothetical protein